MGSDIRCRFYIFVNVYNLHSNFGGGADELNVFTLQYAIK